MTAWIWPLVLLGLAGVALAQSAPPDSLIQKQIAMLHAEAQFFAALAEQQKGELEKLKAAPPCKTEGGG